jgi:hypothetical protein
MYCIHKICIMLLRRYPLCTPTFWWMKSNLLEPLRPVCYFGKRFELCRVRPRPRPCADTRLADLDVFALLRPHRKTTALSRITGGMQVAELPLSRTSTSDHTPDRLPLPDSSRRSPRPSLALSSIAAPTTANLFLLVSLIENASEQSPPPQHPAPRHFRSRLTTFRPSATSELPASARNPAPSDPETNSCHIFTMCQPTSANFALDAKPARNSSREGCH